MSTSSKRFLFLIILAVVSIIYADRPTPSFISFRSLSRDTAAKLVGTTDKIFLPNMDECYSTFFIRPTFKQSFRGNHITECLFGDSLKTVSEIDTLDGRVNLEDCDKDNLFLQITPNGPFNPAARREDRNNEKDLMSENFYFPQEQTSIISFNPRVYTFSIDFHWYIGFDNWCKGLYMRLYGPFVHSRYDLRFSESNIIDLDFSGAQGSFNGEFSSGGIPPDDFLQSFEAYGRGDSLDDENIPISNIGPPLPITTEGLANAKITTDKQTVNCFGDLRLELGYNIVLEDDRHVGLNVQMAAPTGPRPEGEFLFEPQCGNNKHWELGIGLTVHKTLWECKGDKDKKLTFWLEADVTHLFRAKECRTLDLIDKPLSRYMLAQQMDTDSTNQGNPGQVVETNNVFNTARVAFNGTYAPVANFSTRKVRVDASVQTDISALCTYTCDCFSWNVGYNFWLRTCERVRFDSTDCNQFPENRWALKGDASVYGFASASSGSVTENQPFALSTSQQQKANIHVGGNRDFLTPTAIFNGGVDNRKLASVVSDPTVTPPTTVVLKPIPLTTPATVHTSIQPITISITDLDLCSAATRGLSHKIFTHFSYTFTKCKDWKPYIGIGAEAEFGKRDKLSSKTNSDNGENNCPTSRSECLDCALTQWGVWLKAGVSYH